jgi:nucleotide-binding universal stress UspA family protein
MGQAGQANATGRVLVGWDGSDDAHDAVRLAAALARGGHIVAVTVSSPAAYHAEPHDPVEPTAADPVEAEETEIRTAIGATANGCALDYRVLTGDRVVEALCAYAREHGFDLVVVGRHGTGGLRHARLGHVAEGLARSDGVSVLITGA